MTIRSIAAAHDDGLPLLPKDGSDDIFIVDVGGVRVAVFGDLGQDALTPDQMDQVRPAVLIPTHIDTVAAAKMAGDAWETATGR